MKVTLHPDAVIAPARVAMRDSLEMIAISLDALAKSDLQKIPEIPNCFNNFRFNRPENEDADLRKATLTRWLLTKGFQELVRGMHETLERAYLFVSIMHLPDGITTEEKFNADVAAMRRRASRMTFPDLMTQVNKGLTTSLVFEAELLSLQKVRNCLEHRAGIVGADDTKGTEALRLVLPVLKIFTEIDGAEVELGHDIEDRRVIAGQLIKIRRDSRERMYLLGEQIRISPADFQEMTQACFIFTTDLITKLPARPEALTPS